MMTIMFHHSLGAFITLAILVVVIWQLDAAWRHWRKGS